MNSSIIAYFLKFFKIKKKTIEQEIEPVSQFYASVKTQERAEKKYNSPQTLNNNPEFQKIIKNLKKRLTSGENLRQNEQVYIPKKDKENAL